MAAILKDDVMSEIRLHQPMHNILFTCSRKTPARCHPDPTWNDGALGFFKRSIQEVGLQQEEQWAAI